MKTVPLAAFILGHPLPRFQLQKAVTFHLCASTVYFSAIGTKAFCACAALRIAALVRNILADL